MCTCIEPELKGLLIWPFELERSKNNHPELLTSNLISMGADKSTERLQCGRGKSWDLESIYGSLTAKHLPTFDPGWKAPIKSPPVSGEVSQGLQLCTEPSPRRPAKNLCDLTEAKLFFWGYGKTTSQCGGFHSAIAGQTSVKKYSWLTIIENIQDSSITVWFCENHISTQKDIGT